MIMLLERLLTREAIIATAVAGGVLVTAASFRAVREKLGDGAILKLSRTGYALTGVSMLLMIAAGFVSGR